MLSIRSLPLRSAAHHWRANLPVLLGVAVGAAVLAGALVVGDSLRGSLRDRAERQLNGVSGAYVGPRLVRDAVAAQLPGRVAAGLVLQGSVRSEPTPGDAKHVDGATVVGVDATGIDALGLPSGDGVVLSAAVADRLGVAAGGTVELGLEKASAVPRSSVLGRRSQGDVTTTTTVPVAAVLPPDHPANDFALSPNPSAPANVFAPLGLLQRRVGLAGKANALLSFGGDGGQLDDALKARLTLADWGLRVRVADRRKAYVSVEAESLILDPATVRAVEDAVHTAGARSERTYSYLANAITPGPEPTRNDQVGKPDAILSYATVAALNPSAGPPLGPFLPAGVDGLADDEIVLVDWPDSPFRGKLTAGDKVTLSFFKPELEAAVEEGFATFTVRGFVPLEGVAADPDLTPPFPGITDRLTIADWDAPFPLTNARVRPRDERFWDTYKATPKAYVTRSAGERLWGSRFGDVTSVRVAPAPGLTVEQTADRLRDELPKHLDPAAAGLRFDDVRGRLLAASRGGTDFGALFLAFSTFLIGSALLLVGLLFRLAVDRRAKEVGVLLAAGYGEARVRRLFLTEGLAVAALGAAVGLAAAVGYAAGLIRLMAELWPTDDVARVLRLHVGAGSLVAGFVGTVLIAAAAVRISLRGLVRVPAPALLRGETATAEDTTSGRKPWLSVGVAAVSLGAGGGLLAVGGNQPNPDLRAMTFFAGGGLLLAAGLLAGRAWLRWPRQSVVGGTGAAALAGLGARNATRNPARSLLTAALIAVAAFLLVAVESFRRTPDADFLEPTGGSGGFRLLARADVPVFQPFDAEPGRGDLLDRLQAVYQKAEARGGPPRSERLAAADKVLSQVKTVPLRVQAGDDASCLNLYQAGRPRVVGVPAEAFAGRFRFAQTEAATDEERANPWRLLGRRFDDGAVPAFAEQNSAMWMLKVPVGGDIAARDESGREVKLRLVGTLQDSVFQSEVLVSDAHFRRLFPRQEGFRLFLVNGPPETAGLLETGLAANGLSVTPTAERVAAYQKVIGTYLTTFQLLGGLGLVLGVLGLGAVILRAVWERVGELALLRAVGYRVRALQGLILAENLLLLLMGLGVGVAAAVASVLPNAAAGGSVAVGRVAALVGVVLVAGLAATAVATARAARVPVVPALRKE